MTESDKSRDRESPSENIFHIVDGIVRSVDRTKKLVLIMLIAIVVSIPISVHLTSVLVGPPYSFGPARIIIPAILVIVFLITGIRQWIVLSRWTSRYKSYKELQEKLDEKFDFESQDNSS